MSRSGYCQWRVRLPSQRSQANAALDAKVKAVYLASQPDSDDALPIAANALGRQFDGKLF